MIDFEAEANTELAKQARRAYVVAIARQVPLLAALGVAVVVVFLAMRLL